MTALIHSHSGLAYVLCFACLVNVALSLSSSKNPAALARLMTWSHGVVLWGGRINLLVGILLMVQMDLLSSANILDLWWAWLPLLIWGGVEVASKRLVNPELKDAKGGVPPSGRLLKGFVIELLVVIAIFGMMSAH